MTPRWLAFAGSAAIAAVDRVTKIWVDTRLDAFEEITVIPGFFQIVHAENRGMAFSLFADAPHFWRVLLLTGVASVVMAAVAWFLWRTTSTRERLALSLVLGGAAGNLYDRVVRGSVTDFLDLYIGSYHWPTFNVADSAITLGALLLLTSALFSGRSVAGKVPG